MRLFDYFYFPQCNNIDTFPFTYIYTHYETRGEGWGLLKAAAVTSSLLQFRTF